MRDFVVKHPWIAIHLYGFTIGLAGAAAGLTMHGIIWLGFAVGIPYSIVTNRWAEAAARERSRERTASHPYYSRGVHAAKPIHPR